MKIIDIYIIKKFLGTFLYAISLLAVIIIVFDISEKTDEFVENNAPLSEIIFSYYANFLPYFINLFSALFTFIAVIFFTSKMAYNTEIIAILSNGISFRRMLRPFLISSVLIGMGSFLLSNFVIPNTNEEMMDFQWEYLKSGREVENRNIHMKITPTTHIYVETYNADRNIGRKFAMEKFEEGKLVSKITSDYVKWQPEEEAWEVHNYIIRHIDESDEKLKRGAKLDTVIPLTPKDFVVHKDDLKTMDWWELRDFIAKEKMKGASNVTLYQVEKQQRIAFPFANIILTMIGVALSSRKVRGGIGMHLGVGLLLTFSYILFMEVSSVFSTYGSLNPLIAVWIPNIVYAIISLFLIKTAPK